MPPAPTHAIVFEGLSPSVETEIRPLLANLLRSEIDVGFAYRPPQPQAFFEWLMPAALAIWLADKYFGTLVEKTAEAHFETLNLSLPQLYDKVFGKDPAVSRVIRQADGKLRPDQEFSGNLSLGYHSPEGWRVRLLIRLGSTEAQFARACRQFLALLRAYKADPAASSLEAEVAAQAQESIDGLPEDIGAVNVRYAVNLVVFWDESAAQFMVADPAASSRTGALVSWPLGHRR